MTKPAYRIPSMAEVAAVEPAGLVAASTFSGCGGSSLGYRMAGFRVAYANEFVEAARETYLANASPETFMDDRDIRDVHGVEIAAKCGGEIDLLDGSPPCSDFSTAGKREQGWGKVKEYSETEQRVDDLFFEFARIVRQARPRVFVAENVSGLVKGTAKGYFKLILGALRDCGYRVEARLLNAAWLGVPQARQRVIFVGVREDQPFDPVFPKPLPYQYTVREALFDNDPNRLVVFDTSGQFTVQNNTDKPAQTITTSGHGHFHVFGDDVTHDPETGQDLQFRKYRIYDAWKRLGIGESPSSTFFNLVRVNPDKPCPTVVTVGGNIGATSITHWEIPRKFTLAELRRICAFPDDFVLTGTFAQRYERLGRAVPPLMMKAVAEVLRDQLLAARPAAAS